MKIAATRESARALAPARSPLILRPSIPFREPSTMATTASSDVLGIGNAIVDVIAHAEEAFLAERDLPKGTMRLIDAAEADRLYDAMAPGVELSGGSVANT